MKHHDLKIWPMQFAEVLAGRKTFEIRLNDRDYQSGDTVTLREWEPLTHTYTGKREGPFTVGTVIPGGEWGLPESTCVFSLLRSTTPVAGMPGEVEEARAFFENPDAGRILPTIIEHGRVLLRYIRALPASPAPVEGLGKPVEHEDVCQCPKCGVLHDVTSAPLSSLRAPMEGEVEGEMRNEYDLKNMEGKLNPYIRPLRATRAGEGEKPNNLIKSCAEQHDDDKRTIAILRERIRALIAKSEGEFWFWAGDDTDHLESLTCPVLIRAQELREIVANAGAKDSEGVVAWATPEAFDGRANIDGVVWLTRAKQMNKASQYESDRARAAAFTIPLYTRPLPNGLREALGDLVKYIEREVGAGRFPRFSRDHACSECLENYPPEGREIVIPGFQCAWHKARLAASLSPDAPTTKNGEANA